VSAQLIGDPDRARVLRFILFKGSALDFSIHFDTKQDLQLIAGSPKHTLSVCRYAVDTAYRMQFLGDTAKRAHYVGGWVHAIAKECVERAPSDFDAGVAFVEGRIYKAVLLEHVAAASLRELRPSSPRTENHAERWRIYARATRDLARIGVPTGRAADYVLRAIDLGLAGCYFIGADRSEAVKGLGELEALLPEKARDSARAAVRAALLLSHAEHKLASKPPDKREAARSTRAGLERLAPFIQGDKPPAHVIRRHNDLVTLAKVHRSLKIKAEYHLAPCEVALPGFSVSMPLSRAWRVLEWNEIRYGVRQFEVARVAPAGDRLSTVKFEALYHGKRPDKLAAEMYERDKGYGRYDASKIRRRTRPKRVRLGSSAKITAYHYEVFAGGSDGRPWYRRLRVWIVAGKKRSYAIRLEDSQSDGVDKAHHPELVAFLGSVEVR
jgi:hypothetical protein